MTNFLIGHSFDFFAELLEGGVQFVAQLTFGLQFSQNKLVINNSVRFIDDVHNLINMDGWCIRDWLRDKWKSYIGTKLNIFNFVFNDFHSASS